MNVAYIVKLGSFVGMGMLTAACGFGLQTWQFWAFMVILLIGTAAARAEPR
jgi:type IV secretory pathway TrbD component